ncbi:MAG: hypothetical protein AAGD96_30450 [Chloroflexota bacterium]
MTHHHHHDPHHKHATSTGEPLTHGEFLNQFKNKTLNPAHFDHVGHLRLAWIYLNHHDLETSVEGVCSGIKAYAESLGANGKFHLTITDSLVRIVAKRLEEMPQKDLHGFLEQNQDLVDDAVFVLLNHYSKERLFSDTARVSLLEPDLQPI